jgi:riboflavin kinase/FMN adenylyltransferase
VETVGPAVVTIGFFDGVHRGHERLVVRAGELSHAAGSRAVAVTFWPRPKDVLRPDEQAPLLTTLDEKLAIFEGLGLLDAVLVIPFSEALADLSPEAFLDRVGAFCAPQALVEGDDFALGRARTGDVATLRRIGAERGFTVETLDVRDDAGERISSSSIRALVRAGDVAGAAMLLGRHSPLTGEVVRGDQRGRLLGFPTANLRVDARKALPANGVYAVRARLPGEAAAERPAVCNIGVRPTFGGEPKLLVEVHLLDAAMDLYGLPLGIELVARLRDERRFGGVDELKAQIARDADQARALLAGGAAVV